MAVEPRCPRCDYDLSGQMAAWPPDRCLTEVRCSECGLKVGWRDLLNPRYFILQGHFEHAAQRRVRALMRTLAAVPRPWRLWSWLRMSHDIVWRRAFVVVAAASALLYLTFAIVNGAVVLATGRVAVGYISLREAFLTLVWPYWGYWSWAGFPIERPPTVVLTCLLTMLLTPAAFLLLPETLKRARVRRAHLIRIGLYLMPSFVVSLMLPAIVYNARGAISRATASAVPFRAPLTDAAIVLSITTLWCIVWWWFAADRYLRLPRPLVLASVRSVVAMLAAITLTIVIGLLIPEFARECFKMIA